MSKKLSEQVLNEMIFACKAMSDAANDLKALLAEEAGSEVPPEAVTDKPEAAEPEKTYTFQEVRGIMSTLSGMGKKAEAKALLAKYGASRLSEVSETDYPALVHDAEVISNG